MKKISALLVVVFLVFSVFSSYATNIRDDMTFDGPVTFNGAVTQGTATTTTQTVTTQTVTTLNVSTTLNSNGNTTLGNAATDTVTVTGTIQGGSPFVFEGATDDDYETTLSIADPTADRTITLPDYTGGVPLVIGQGATTTTQSGTGSSDVTGSSLSIASGWLTAGKSIKWTVAGTKSGANAQSKVHLYLSDGYVMSLTASDSTAVDWIADFTLHEYTDAAHQKVIGCLKTGTNMIVCDYAAATKDVSGAVTAKVVIESQHASDNVVAEYVLVEHWVK